MTYEYRKKGLSDTINVLPPAETFSQTTAVMDDFNSETDSSYTSYWRDWVCRSLFDVCIIVYVRSGNVTLSWTTEGRLGSRSSRLGIATVTERASDFSDLTD